MTFYYCGIYLEKFTNKKARRVEATPAAAAQQIK